MFEVHLFYLYQLVGRPLPFVLSSLYCHESSSPWCYVGYLTFLSTPMNTISRSMPPYIFLNSSNVMLLLFPTLLTKNAVYLYPRRTR